jgi:deoxyribose-phosphate aldolase
MSPSDLDALVAQIGDELLARVGARSTDGRAQRGEGLNIADLVCPDCVQRCPQTCHKKTQEILHAGADRVSASNRLTRIDPAIAALIDHTLLKPDATEADIRKLCAEARQYGFASVCVNSYWVPLVAELLKSSPVKVCTVVGFPLGATLTEAKRAETEAAVRCGASEIDMVINIGALRSCDAERVKQDIAAVVAVAHAAGATVKVILETALLDDNQKALGCTLAKLAGADFVKTSTGFGPHGATVHDVALMRSIVGPDIGVKASGGIRTLEDLRRMAAAGATRIGASASVKIVEATASGARGTEGAASRAA